MTERTLYEQFIDYLRADGAEVYDCYFNLKQVTRANCIQVTEADVIKLLGHESGRADLVFQAKMFYRLFVSPYNKVNDLLIQVGECEDISHSTINMCNKAYTTIVPPSFSCSPSDRINTALDRILKLKKRFTVTPSINLSLAKNMLSINDDLKQVLALVKSVKVYNLDLGSNELYLWDDTSRDAMLGIIRNVEKYVNVVGNPFVGLNSGSIELFIALCKHSQEPIFDKLVWIPEYKLINSMAWKHCIPTGVNVDEVRQLHVSYYATSPLYRQFPI